MGISNTGLQLIKRFEGFSPVPYVCPAGIWTIGYGHVLLPGEHVALTEIDAARAEMLLRADVGFAEQAVAKFIERPIYQNQCDALVSFTFNLGGAALQRSALRRVINRDDDSAVAKQWMRWVWAGGRKLPGLMKRRAAELLVYQDADGH